MAELTERQKKIQDALRKTHYDGMASESLDFMAKIIDEKISDPSDNPVRSLGFLSTIVHAANQKWWHDPHNGSRLKRNYGELMMLAVSELAESMEGHRKELMDDHLPDQKMYQVEIADCIIRLLDIAGSPEYGFDLEKVLLQKLAYNRTRADHSHEARMLPNGKKY